MVSLAEVLNRQFFSSFGLAVGTFFDFLVTRGGKPKKAPP